MPAKIFFSIITLIFGLFIFKTIIKIFIQIFACICNKINANTPLKIKFITIDKNQTPLIESNNNVFTFVKNNSIYPININVFLNNNVKVEGILSLKDKNWSISDKLNNQFNLNSIQAISFKNIPTQNKCLTLYAPDTSLNNLINLFN